MITRNRQQVITNPYQGEVKKVLCVCSAGVLRSPTAAGILQREYGYNTRAAGAIKDLALIPLEEGLLAWADEIVCMSPDQLSYIMRLLDEYKLQTRAVCLHIPDNYAYMDSDLISLIIERYKERLDEEEETDI